MGAGPSTTWANAGTLGPEYISTAGVPPWKRSAFWNDALCRVFTQLEARPDDSNDFTASLRRIDLGDLSFSRVVSSGCLVQHTNPRECADSEPVFLLHLQANGASVNSQNGREARLGTSDFTICASTHPYALDFEGINDMLVLRIPAEKLRNRIMEPEQLTAIAVSGTHGPGSLVSHAICQWWSLCSEGLSADLSCRIADNVLDLVAIALAATTPAQISACSASNANRLRIYEMIERHVANPRLDAQLIAASLDVTPRYVHRLMEPSGETLGQRILRRRLEVCAKRLRDPSRRHLTVTEIAFDFGFSDSSYFSRCFRRYFGLTPTEYRHKTGSGCASRPAPLPILLENCDPLPDA